MAAGDANCRLPRGASLAAGCVRQRDAGGRVRRQRPLAKVLGDTECPSLSHAMTAAGRVRLGRCERRCCGRDCARGLRAAALSASGPRTAVSPAPPGLGLPALLRAAGRVGPARLPVSSPAGPPTSAWTGPRRSRVASSRPVLAQNVGGLSRPGLGPPPRRRQGPAGMRCTPPATVLLLSHIRMSRYEAAATCGGRAPSGRGPEPSTPPSRNIPVLGPRGARRLLRADPPPRARLVPSR